MKGRSGKALSQSGETGVSSMIFIIAVILVSAIAAGLLIQTVSDLAGRGGRVGKDVTGSASSQFNVDSITIADVDSDQDVDDLYFSVKLAPGSRALDLRSTVVTLSSEDRMAQLEYVSSLAGEDATHFNCEAPSSTDGGSGRSGVISDPENRFTIDGPVVSSGTVVTIHVDLVAAFGGPVIPGERFDLRTATDKTFSFYVQFTIPETILSSLVVLE